MAAAREDDAKAEDEEDSAACAYQKEADETTAEDQAAAEVDDDDEADDPVIRNLNLMSRRNLMTPEWIENRKKMHYQDISFYNRVYDALHNGEIETDSDDDDDDGTAAAQRSKRLWAGVDLSGLNIVGGESRGMDAVAVYPPNSPQEEGHQAAAAAAESSS